MTNPTPHGQVPEALRLAEEISNLVCSSEAAAKTIAAAADELCRLHVENASLRAALAASPTPPALSAAPAVHASVKGAMWFTKKPVTIQAIQWTGDNLREVITFTNGPPDICFHHAGMAWDAYRDLVARDGLKIYTLEGKMLASPGDWIIRGVKGELYPCKPDIFQETYAAASPTPPAEQQVASSAVLKAIHEANMQLVRTGDDAFMLVPYKVATVEQQAAPKAAPTRTALPEGWTDCTIEFGNDGPEVVAYGPKRMMTRLAKWLGKYFAQVIAEAAPKAAPGEPSAFPMTGDEEESDLGQWQPGTAKPNMDGTYLREFDEGEATSEFHQGVWLRDGFFPSDLQDVRWRGRAAPQQEAQEPATVPYQKLTDEIDLILSDPDTELSIGAKRALLWVRTWVSVPLYAAPQPAPAPLSERDAFEAWIKKDGGDLGTFGTPPNMHYRNSAANNAWVAWKARAAITAQGGQ